MVNLLVFSAWFQVAQLCYTLAAVFQDVLLIRFSLLIANTVLILNNLLGLPVWGMGLGL